MEKQVLTANSDLWNGTIGAEWMEGLGGSDTMDGGAGADSLIGGAGDDFIAGGSGNDTIRGGSENDVLDGGIGNDQLFGDLGDDILHAGVGLDTLKGGGGNDYLNGGAEDDKLFGEAGSDSLFGADGADLLVDGVSTTNYGSVSTENDELNGGSGNDTFYGGYDTMWGGEGNDVFNVRNQGEIYGGIGDDKILLTNTNSALGSWLDGGLGNDSVRGGAGADTLISGYGQDTLVGGAGNDSYVLTFDNMPDVVQEAAGGGIDTVYFIRDFKGDGRDDDVGPDGKELDPPTTAEAGGPYNFNVQLAANIENGVLDDQVYVNNPNSVSYTIAWLSGNGLDNTLTGSNLYDVLEGGAGNDTIYAGDGDDTIVAGDGVDVIYGGAGSDWIASLTGFDLREVTAVENLDLLDIAGAATATGNAGHNIIVGNASDNVLVGLAGNDTLDGWYYSPFYAPVSGSDKSTGLDTLKGGTGDDLYRIDSADDIVIEHSGTTGGIDTVEFKGTVLTEAYVLTAGVENLIMLGNLNSGIGNSLNNRIIGDSRANVIKGGYGDDHLDGSGGNDTFEGGYGDDVFVVDSYADAINEFEGQGNDWVESSKINLDLNVQGNWTDIENARLTGTSKLNVSGRETNNELVGNDGENVLDGRGGIDTLKGGLGNDTYLVDTLTDTLVEVSNQYDGTGKIKTGWIDTVQSDIDFSLEALLDFENLSLSGTVAVSGTGNANDNYIRGNDIANTLYGLAGADTLAGSGGADSLYGGAGNDVYLVANDGDVVFENADEGIDTIEFAGTFTLVGKANVENLTIAGTTSADGTGNELDNTIVGNSATNLLTGGLGNDTLKGGEGADTLIGGAGTDTLDLTESTAAKDVVRFAAGDSAPNTSGADNVIKFAGAYDTLDLAGTIVVSTVAGTNGIDSGSIKSHRITKGIIEFDDIDSYTYAMTISSTNLNDAVNYVSQNVTNGSVVAFKAGSDTWVFQDNGDNDMLIKLTGTSGFTSISTSTWSTTTLHVE